MPLPVMNSGGKHYHAATADATQISGEISLCRSCPKFNLRNTQSSADSPKRVLYNLARRASARMKINLAYDRPATLPTDLLVVILDESYAFHDLSRSRLGEIVDRIEQD